MRQSGILLHISSLPGPEGIGTLGKEARAFADFLAASGVAIWQVLPISPTGYGESPYQSFSTYAGNPLLIDLRTLQEEGLYKPGKAPQWADPKQVDFPAVIAYKDQELREAYRQGAGKLQAEMDAFAKEQAHWLPDYALFRAVKSHFGNTSWMEWPDEAIRQRVPEAMEKYRREFAEEIGFHIFVQHLFFKQWRALKSYVNGLKIDLFGDMPIYVAMDSSDTWANPDCFKLSADRRPTWVAGVPPDYFSQDGQLWGNPLYDWKAHKNSGYRWWISRLRAMGEYFDLIRVDHFIGFANYYAVRYGATTARHGSWRKGPGRHFFTKVRQELPGLRIIAEDLGAVNRKVRLLLKYCGYPGMKVLSFAFTGGEANIHLPGHVVSNSVYYTGTHDNDTVLGWWEKSGKQEQARAKEVLGMKKGDHICDKMVEQVFESKAQRAIVPMQDLLKLPGDARMNLPGTLGGNWLWRMEEGAATEDVVRRLKQLNQQTKRENMT